MNERISRRVEVWSSRPAKAPSPTEFTPLQTEQTHPDSAAYQWAQQTAEVLGSSHARKERWLLNRMLGYRKLGQFVHTVTPAELLGLHAKYAGTEENPEEGLQTFVDDVIAAHDHSWINIRSHKKEIRQVAGFFGEEVATDSLKVIYNHLTPEGRSVISRRAFVGAGAILMAGMLIKDAEVRAGIGAAVSRKVPENKEFHDVSTANLNETYHTLLPREQRMIDFNAWVGKDGIGVNLVKLANASYEEGKYEQETFSEYWNRWFTQFRGIADEYGLDFTVLLCTFKTSGENYGSLVKQIEDVSTSQKQNLFPLLRKLGLDEFVLHTAGPEGIAPVLTQWGRESSEDISVEGSVVPASGIWHYDLLRLQSSAITTGYMDYEPGERALAYASLPAKLKDKFAGDYGSIAKAYQEAQDTHATREQIRTELATAANKLIEGYSAWLDVFLEDTESGSKAREAIGLGENITDWQVLHYTDAWFEQSVTPTTQVSLSERVLASMKRQYVEDKQKFYHDFVSQQVLNQEFIGFLLRKARESKDGKAIQVVNELNYKQKEFSLAGKVLSEKYLSIAAREGELEYDSKFQQTASVITTKYISEIAGTYNPESRDDVYWHLYKFICLREMSSPYVLVHGSEFAKDPIVDHPYDRKAYSAAIDEYVDTLFELNMIQLHPSADIKSFFKVTNDIRFRNKRAFSMISDSKWDSLVERFNRKTITRLYMDGGRYEEIRNVQGMDRLIEFFLKNKLIEKTPEENVLPFYKVLESFIHGGYHNFPQLKHMKWEEIDAFVQMTIPEILKNKIKTPWGEMVNSPIRWAEYPSHPRALDLMWWLLDRGENTDLTPKQQLTLPQRR